MLSIRAHQPDLPIPDERDSRTVLGKNRTGTSVVNLAKVSARQRQSPHTPNAATSGTANEKFGSLREPAQRRSSKTKARGQANCADLTRVEYFQVDTFKIGVGQLLPIR